MPHDQPRSITLTIADCQSDLQVVGFTGREALNETWRFDIDLISCDPHLDISTLQQRRACLKPAPDHPGLHGEIGSASQLYAGTCLSHYRLSLRPHVQRLAQPRRQHLFQDLSVPQVIEHVLRERGLDAAQYRFEPLRGVYPPRALCAQHQESDLHLLQRLCEEEGIHFRFEGQQLVFADDCASFPERHGALRVTVGEHPATESISPLLESISLPPAQVRQPESVAHDRLPLAPDSPSPGEKHADNQAYPQDSTPLAHDLNALWQRQRSARRLQRLRGERRQITGCSSLPTLVCGQIVHVLGQPEPHLNDYWLLNWIRHVGKQPEVLEGHDPHDVAAIIRIVSSAPLPEGLPDDRFHSGYRNSFGVTLWTEPFRPALRHPKPAATGMQAATLMGSEQDAQGCLPIRMDWQTQPCGHSGWPHALVARNRMLPAHALQVGRRVQIGFLDNDPDRPLICALLPPTDEPASRWFIDDQALEPLPDTVALQGTQTLQIQARGPLTLRGSGTVQLIPQAITAWTPASLHLNHTDSLAPAGLPEPLHDLRLPPQGNTPARCLWYIVRMAQPGLEHLSRLNPEHFLFEGRTDAEGFLGLTPEQRRQLALEYARAPDNLCLIHPGRCMTLKEFFHQYSRDNSQQAWLDSTWAALKDTPS